MNALRTTTLSVLLAMLGSAPVSAATTGVASQRLGDELDDFDRWELVCTGGTGARAKVTDRSDEGPDNPALMEVFIYKNNLGVLPAIAPNEGTSGWAQSLQSGGVYSVRFEKNAGDEEYYYGVAECVGGTQGTFTRKQNN